MVLFCRNKPSLIVAPVSAPELLEGDYLSQNSLVVTIKFFFSVRVTVRNVLKVFSLKFSEHSREAPWGVKYSFGANLQICSLHQKRS